MKIAIAQLVSSIDPEENLTLIRSAVADATGQGAELVLFPEAMMRSFSDLGAHPTLTEAAEPEGGPWAAAVKRIAVEAGVTVVVGMFTHGGPSGSGQPRIRNTLLVTGPEVDASYDKIHLYDAYTFRESDGIEPGTEPRLVTIGGIRFGLATCFDIRFPELFKHYAEKGAAAILVSASWAGGPGKVHHWETLSAARAIDSTTYIVACGQADPSSVGQETVDGEPTGVGHSAIIGPDGDRIVTAGAAPEIIIADIDPTKVDEMQRRLPVLAASVLNRA